MKNEKPNFAFGKKLGLNNQLYGDISAINDAIRRLLFCMKETNDLHHVSCEFFRLDFRQPYFDEQTQFPLGSLILDMKWGSKEELESPKKIRCKNCSQYCEATKSIHVCDECFPLVVCDKEIVAKPKCQIFQ